MSDVELVIKIPETTYEMIKEMQKRNGTEYMNELEGGVAKGVPLPKGHGRLGDLDKLEVLMKDEVADGTNEYGCLSLVHRASTIIEADKAESEERT